ncbi:MAG: radical SAM protein [Acidobacteria bacterium]|nr:radical SAM protein [Acidobacteriota bacterium]
MNNETPLERIYRKIYENRHLYYASYELTFKCNFACRFCYNPVEREGQNRAKKIVNNEEPLTLEEIFKLLKDLRRAGVLYFTLTGGEPIVHPHFWEIVEKAKESAFLIRVFTNGSLINEDAAKRFGRILPNCIEITIYGASEESYEKNCGRGKLFPQVLKALELLKREKITVYLKCTLTRFNEDEIDKIQDLADSFNFPLNFDPILQISDDGERYPLDFKASEKAVEKLFKGKRFNIGNSPFEGEERKTLCNIGRNLIHIDPYGNIYPCIQYREKIGNVKEDDISELFKNSKKLLELMDLAEDISQKMKKERIFCRHCIGKSKMVYNDETRLDDDELYIAKLKEKHRK